MRAYVVIDPNGTPNTIELQLTSIGPYNIKKQFTAEFPKPQLSAGSVEPITYLLDTRRIKEFVNFKANIADHTDYESLISAIRTEKDGTYGPQVDLYLVSNDGVVKTVGYSAASPYSSTPTFEYIAWKHTSTSGGGNMTSMKLDVADIEDNNDTTYTARYKCEFILMRGVKLG